MDNKGISKILLKAGKLLELHEANPFKVRSYQNAAFNIEKLAVKLFETDPAEFEKIEGLGKNLAPKIIDILDRGSFDELDRLLEETPDGVIELLDVKGVGPKKIRSLWKDHEILSVDELYDAAQEGKLAEWKGFGQKTQQTILENLEFAMAQKGKVYFAEAEFLSKEIIEFLSNKVQKIEVSGDAARFMDVVDNLQFIVSGSYSELEKALKAIEDFEIELNQSGPYALRGKFRSSALKVEFLFSELQSFGNIQIYNSADIDHLTTTNSDGDSIHSLLRSNQFDSEKAVYEAMKSPFIPAELREGMVEWELAKIGKIDSLLTDNDLRGTLHNHSTYSDGKNTLKEMAEEAKNLGLEYLGISDHSKSAFYANGLDENRIIQQHEEIDRLNQEMAPFKIFKGIESDILNDGSLDYADSVLASFDFIVSSIHSSLGMDERKATARLLKAIENPYTTMLGHPTGRLLLKRKGYPINHKMIIDACAENNVIIEINANPWRLDLSWEWVHYAIEKGVWLSINPDAHELKGYQDMHYGVCVGRKGGLQKEQTFNALGLNEVESYFNKRKKATSA